MEGARVGVAEHGNEAVLVTVSAAGDLLDRRCVALTTDLPTHPHHHEGSWAVGRYRDSPWARDVTLAEAVSLVAQVRAAALVGARDALVALAEDVPAPIVSISLRVCPPLPPTTEARITDARAQTVADGVMYRQAIATAAEGRGWAVWWYARDEVFAHAAAARGWSSAEAPIAALGRAAGPPWRAIHKLAAAAALAAP